MSIVGTRLKKAREWKNLKQTQVKERTGINNKTLSGYENGVSEPDLDTLKQLAELYEVSIDYLTGYTDDPKKILSENAKNMLDALELSDEEAIEKYNVTVDGKKLTPEQIKKILAYVRIERATDN